MLLSLSDVFPHYLKLKTQLHYWKITIVSHHERRFSQWDLCKSFQAIPPRTAQKRQSHIPECSRKQLPCNNRGQRWAGVIRREPASALEHPRNRENFWDLCLYNQGKCHWSMLSNSGHESSIQGFLGQPLTPLSPRFLSLVRGTTVFFPQNYNEGPGAWCYCRGSQLENPTENP